MKLRKIPPMALVIFAVCMVSYSGPMIKGALNAGANPSSIAFLRMFSATFLLLPIQLRSAKQKGIAFLEACGISKDATVEELRALPPEAFTPKAGSGMSRAQGEMVYDGTLVPFQSLRECLLKYGMHIDSYRTSKVPRKDTAYPPYRRNGGNLFPPQALPTAVSKAPDRHKCPSRSASQPLFGDEVCKCRLHLSIFLYVGQFVFLNISTNRLHPSLQNVQPPQYIAKT